MSFVLQGADGEAQGLRWSAISHAPEAAGSVAPEETVLSRVTADKPFVAAMQARLHPGAVLILTDAPLEPDSRSGRDFVIMS